MMKEIMKKSHSLYCIKIKSSSSLQIISSFHSFDKSHNEHDICCSSLYLGSEFLATRALINRLESINNM